MFLFKKWKIPSRFKQVPVLAAIERKDGDENCRHNSCAEEQLYVIVVSSSVQLLSYPTNNDRRRFRHKPKWSDLHT